ncbi:MAG: hypothetical protein A2W90_01050 [Bacteroidetes bacterium GWF2_42_66]|nr:MAG: hypothetical protein A2W92_00470 [Bacteroidetes bacterium GWA2_42_15]OFY00971.1 MAG: hypothetical protein A2W89_14540 [Bacteroidetes bacterium GWE2_42_39]OFY41811.1 MAG: hypothetical protein A2W90_01050 [Bacteroidetes bacterium GWF2_42_66]HBL78021.1 hypothetical protein [Prolixibacteraceae bacterium]HCR89843.1 hypothetical protein [Prolixibacteraceae bacterium]
MRYLPVYSSLNAMVHSIKVLYDDKKLHVNFFIFNERRPTKQLKFNEFFKLSSIIELNRVFAVDFTGSVAFCLAAF